MKQLILWQWRFVFLIDPPFPFDFFGYLLPVQRYQEPEKMRRTWGIWAADSSKQAIGAFVAHGANMLISYGWASGAQDNECLFYLVNFVADCVVGLAFNIILLKASVHVAEKYFNSDVLTSGEYGNPFEWSRWLAQLSAWLMVTLIAKALLVFAVVLPFKDPLYRLVDVIFRPLNKYPQLELVLIMVVIPLVLNALTFWIQDHFLMKPLEDSTGVWAKDNFDDVDEDILAAIARLEYGDVADDHVDQSTREALVNPQSRGFRLFADGANSYS